MNPELVSNLWRALKIISELRTVDGCEYIPHVGDVMKGIAADALVRCEKGRMLDGPNTWKGIDNGGRREPAEWEQNKAEDTSGPHCERANTAVSQPDARYETPSLSNERPSAASPTPPESVEK